MCVCDRAVAVFKNGVFTTTHTRTHTGEGLRATRSQRHTHTRSIDTTEHVTARPPQRPFYFCHSIAMSMMMFFK